jgi:hypothetical protein
MVYDAADGYIVLFDSRVTPTTWAYNGSWRQLNTSGGPSDISDFSMTYDAYDGYVLVFGGQSVSGTNATWSYANGTWRLLHPTIAPPPRFGASLTYDSTDRCDILFGGVDTSNAYLNDTWTFAKGNWTNVTSKVNPPARKYAELSDDPPDRAAVLFGGWPNGNDTWEFSRGNWTNVTQQVAPPIVNRGGFVFDAALGGAVLFGGSLTPGAGGENETWIFENGSWLRLTPSPAPSPREYVDMAFDPLLFRLVLLGPYVSIEDQWEFGAGVVRLVPTPSGDGTIGVDYSPAQSYSSPTTVDLGFGNHTLTQSASPWAVFSSWNATGSLSLWGAHPPASENTTILGNGTITVRYTPHPSLTFLVDPSTCDEILLQGLGYPSGSSASLYEGNYSASAPQCPVPPTYLVFSYWSSDGSLSIANPTDANTTVSLSGNGTLIAHYVAQLTLYASSPSQGSVLLNSTLYSNGATLDLPVGNYSLLPVPEPWSEFLRWTTLGGLSVGAGLAHVASTGTLTALFRFAPLLGVGLSPPTCGALTVNGSSAASGTSVQLPLGAYPLRAPSCNASSELFEDWALSGGLSVSAIGSPSATLTVTGNGTLVAQYVPGYSVRFQVEGGNGGAILLNGTLEPNGSAPLLAAGNYPLNATAAGTGFVLLRWATTGEVHVEGGVLNVAGPGSVSALFAPMNSTGHGGTTGLSGWVYGVGSLVVLAVLITAALVLRRRWRRHASVQE